MPRKTSRCLTAALLCLAPVFGVALPARATLQPPAFSVTGLKGWSAKTFTGSKSTQYHLVRDDGVQVLHAVCHNAASGMYWQGDIDLRKTPILHWRWKIAHIYPHSNEMLKSGDDFPARVYVVHGTRWLPWTLKSLAYVWSNGSGHGSDGNPFWPSAYTDQEQILAVRSGPAGVGKWQTEARNVRADFKRAFNETINHIDGVAIMTDCDNTHGNDQAWYGDLSFSAK